MMSLFWTKIIVQEALRRRKQQGAGKNGYSAYEMAKAYRELKISVWALIKDVLLIMLGVASAAFGLKSFLLPSNFFDGGATGIALLLRKLTGIHLSLLLLAVNLPFLWMGYRVISAAFAIKTAAAITALALVTGFVQFGQVTSDKLLVAVFGGFFLGAGIGLSIRGGSVIDGTEILALWLSKKTAATIGDIIIIINIAVFSAVAWLLNIDTALYAMITYLAASKTVDFVVEGIDEYSGVVIVSTHFAEIQQMIADKLGRGVTVYKGRGGFGSSGISRERDILYTVVTRLEIGRLKTEIEKIDPHAFLVMQPVRDLKGGLVKKRRLK